MTYIAQLPFLPISVNILAESKFFMSPDPRIIRAGFWMLEAAWRAERTGSIPSSFENLSVITRLSTAEVADNFEVLTSGWDLGEDGRLHYLPLEAIAESVRDRFGAELAVVAESALVACQGGDVEFELAPAAEVKKKKRGMTQLPKDFAFDQATLQSAIAEGYYTQELQDWVLQQFKDYNLADQRKQANWPAAFRNYLGHQYTRQKFLGKFGYPLGNRPAPLMSLDEVQGVKASPADRLRRAASGHSGVFAAKPPQQTFAQIGAASSRNTMLDAMHKRLGMAAESGDHSAAPGMSQ